MIEFLWSEFMATVNLFQAANATPTDRNMIGPEHHGLAMSFDEFIRADFEKGRQYELVRGIILSEKPGIDHGKVVARVTAMFVSYSMSYPGLIQYRAGAHECRVRLPGTSSDRCPDQAVYLHPKPTGPGTWSRWIPQIVAEVVSLRSRDPDNGSKRAEYLLAGVSEYWILDPKWRNMRVLLRLGDTWEEHLLGVNDTHRTELLPGLEVRVGELLGPPVEDDEE